MQNRAAGTKTRSGIISFATSQYIYQEGNGALAKNNKSNKELAALLKDRSFRWLLSGAAISMLGGQFTLIALPWLVLKMTGDPFVLGTVLALIGVPRALFILIGGALVNRFSPKKVLMLSKHVNTALLGLLGVLALLGDLQRGWCTAWLRRLEQQAPSAFHRRPRCCLTSSHRRNCLLPTA